MNDGEEDENGAKRRIAGHGGWKEDGRRMEGGQRSGGIIPMTRAVLHSLGRGTLSLFNWIWVSCCLSAYESPSAPSQLSKPS